MENTSDDESDILVGQTLQPSSTGSMSTCLHVSRALKVLEQYCEANGPAVSVVENDLSLAELCDFLAVFYQKVRKNNGHIFSEGSFRTVRSGLKKHFENIRGVDIMSDERFNVANDAFNATLQMIETGDNGLLTTKSPISREDFLKIKRYLKAEMHNPKGLQSKVFFDILLHLSMASFGKGNLHNLLKSHFDIGQDVVNKRLYVYFTNPHIEDECDGDSKMYQTGQPDCPVASYLAYVSHLSPECNAFWQRPKSDIFTGDNVWYDSAAMGRTGLVMKMHQISIATGNCSMYYSNRNLRATNIEDLELCSEWEEEEEVQQSVCRTSKRKRKTSSPGTSASKSLRSGASSDGLHVTVARMDASDVQRTIKFEDDSDFSEDIESAGPIHVQTVGTAEHSDISQNQPHNGGNNSTSDAEKNFYVINRRGVNGTVVNEFHFHNCTVNIYNK